MAGKNAFSNCQPETCKKINLDIDDKRIKINDTYWLNGYMLTSPIMEYLGCFEMKQTDIATDRTSIPDNDVLMCFLFCKGRGFHTNTVILLKEDACSCLPSSNLIEMTKRIDSRMHQNHNVGCSVQCPGDNTDDCGGNDYFSVYNITKNEIRGREHSCVCENLQNKSIEECKTCPEDLQFLCHNISVKEDGRPVETNCSQIPLAWRQELRTCLKSGASFTISARSGRKCDIDPLAVQHNDFQYSFVKLLFVWNTRPKSKNEYECLGLRLEQNNMNKMFKLLPIDCTETRKALCHKVSDEGNFISKTYQSVSFNVSDTNNTWVKAGNNCDDGWKLSGKDLFKSCRSNSCNTTRANDVLRNVKMKPPFLWIDGFVVRSPIMEYYECISLTDVNSTANALEKTKKILKNGVGKCALFCIQDEYFKKNDGFILLQKDICYCLPFKTLKLWEGQMQMVSTKSCEIRCDEDKIDRCGGKHNIFSAYKVKGLQMSEDIGGNCFSTSGTIGSKDVQRTRCKEIFKIKCEEVKRTVGSRVIDVKCNELILNWYDARKLCNQSGKYIQLLNNKCGNIDEFEAVQLWHNRFIKERIDWNTDNVTDKDIKNGYKCLAMKLTPDSNYTLIASNCDNAYHSLCQKDVSGRNNDDMPPYTTQPSLPRTAQSTMYTDGIPKNKEQETVDLKVSMYVGIAVSLTTLLIVVVVLAVCILRRKRYMHKDVSTIPDVYYSTVTGDQIHENKSHTLDGANADQGDANLMVSAKTINIHTGNDQQEINLQGAMSDQAGVTDSNEYDVSSTCRKYSPKAEEDVGYYDHNRDADTMYDVTDTKGLIQRNEMSQIYDHTREINDDYDVSNAYRQHDKTINESVYSQSDF
ncbi:unnamed protein product [Mytilus edulis]|uniref:WSC domain-containing protein n=1 Tax=Mytilus edulis TaxID=6550 RepID=A0A8S3S726_MYTED|nr:unnamed protein product [Mytilus edulis]